MLLSILIKHFQFGFDQQRSINKKKKGNYYFSSAHSSLTTVMIINYNLDV